MGALTSKPYAFTARPWELKSVYSVDIFDGISSKIRLDLRGTNIMRILPVVYKYINEEWITDKIRFSYDALNRQRLLHVLKNDNGKFYKISLKEGFSNLFHLVNKLENPSAAIIAGKTQDIETLLSFKLWSKRWFKNIVFTQDFLENNFYLNKLFLFRDSLIFNQKKFIKADYVLLLGTNLRYELPILNLKLKQHVKKTNIPVLLLGVNSNFNYNVYNLGANILNLNSFIRGKSFYSSFFSKNRGFWLISPHLVNSSIFEYVKDFVKVYLSLDVYIVSAYNALLSMFVTNFTSTYTGYIKNNFNVIFNLHADDHNLSLKKSSLYVYFGSHGEENSKKADYVFPTAYFFEKKFSSVNIEGIFSKADLGIVPAGDVRSEISYFYAFDKYFYLNNIKKRFLFINNSISVLNSNLYMLCGFTNKPLLHKLYNRWLNLYNTFYGRAMSFNKTAVFVAYALTKKYNIKMHNKLASKYINNYLFTHAYTRASHFLAVANMRYSFNKFNFR